MVYLIGAGPGDPSLLTLKAVEILKRSDVVLYDRLIHSEILCYAKDSLLIPAGKKPAQENHSAQLPSYFPEISSSEDPTDSEAESSSEGNSSSEKISYHAMQQGRINDLLIRYSRQGSITTRLKGGDPCIFGRGGEEALALSKAGIPFTFVPGVSSFYAAPESVGIPLTHRQVSSGFAVFTAHEAAGKSRSTIDWALAAKIPTAVFLMGCGRVSQTAQKLIDFGRSPYTPAAVISRATFPDQKSITSNLSELGRIPLELPSPATMIVGDVVELQKQILPYLSSESVAKIASRS